MVAASALAGLALTAVTVAVTLAGVDSAHAELAATGRALMVIVPVAVGCYAWYRGPHRRFGLLLMAAGFGWFLTTLAESGNSLLYSTGRIAGWLVELELIYLALSFPSGRITERVDRWIVAAALVLVAVLYLPTALIDTDYPVPVPYTSCDSGCPENAFFVLDSEPEFVDSVMRPLRDALATFLFLAVVFRLAQRVKHSTQPMRMALTPVLVVAGLRFLAAGLFVLMRRVGASSEAVEGVAWVAALALPAVAVGFFAGLVRWRLFVASALQTLGLRIGDRTDAQAFRARLADATGDPTLELVYWVPARGGQWVDGEGREATLPEPGSGRRITEIPGGGDRPAAMVHQEVLRDQQELIEAAAGYARIALDNQRLYAELEASLAEVRESRVRMVASAARERRRIERDLHDGAQQRLVALRIKLELADEALEADPETGRARLRALGEEIDATLEEIRALAHGVYPPLLADEGLGEALRAAVRHTTLLATVQVDGIGRYPPEVESAVYFCCLEALQNAAKHADGATGVTISLAQDDRLRFEVRDDGPGFSLDGAAGAGLRNMRDRVSALGGELEIVSGPGGGALVTGSVPLEP